MENKILLSVKNLEKKFNLASGFFSKYGKFVYAVNNISFDIHKNETYGLVGESGCGKTTTARLLEKMYDADRHEIELGEASILSNINGKFREYKIEIQKTFLNNNYDNKNMLIKVTDEELLSKTGGIIQGMSGSPILQNGKFCGAITHVFVNDPTVGYAVFADKMIQELAEN